MLTWMAMFSDYIEDKIESGNQFLKAVIDIKLSEMSNSNENLVSQNPISITMITEGRFIQN